MSDTEEKTTTETVETPDTDAGKEKREDNNGIPYERFKEVNERMKSAELELAKYKEAESKKAEEEALKKGEYEKVISQKDQEIEALKKEQETWKAREQSVADRNNQRIADLEKKFGEKWGEIKNLVDDITDPFVMSSKLDSLEKMSSTATVKAPDGGSKIPGGSGKSRKEELMEKATNGRLTAKERSELFELTAEK